MAASILVTRSAEIIRKHRLLTGLLGGVVGLLGASLLFVWLVLPGIVKTQAEAYILAHSGDRLTIDRVSIVPLFEPRVRIDNLRLTQPNGDVLLAFKHLSIGLSFSSLPR